MLEFDNLRLELEGYEEKIELLRDALHIKQVSDQVSELEARSQEPDYWNDVERAQKEQTKMKRLQKRIKAFEDLATEREDLLVLCELGNEAEDTDVLMEATEGVKKFTSDYDDSYFHDY